MLLVVLIIAICPLPAVAKDHTVVIYDYTGGPWPRAVASDVAAFLPYVPILYRPMGEIPCPTVRPGGIVICHDPEAAHPAKIYANGMAYIYPPRDAPMRREAFLCHEMMHALTGVRDNYNAEPESCVWGKRDSLGVWDVALLKSIYNPPHKKHR